MCVRGFGASESEFSDLVAVLDQKGVLDCLGITEWVSELLKVALIVIWRASLSTAAPATLQSKLRTEKTAAQPSPCCLLQRTHISELHKPAQTMI